MRNPRGWLWWLALCPPALHAQLVIQDTLNGASSGYPWQAIGGACLTAGNDTGSIPSCLSQRRIARPDPVGQGALRLTDAGLNEAGGVISQFTFPSTAGLNVTFTTVTYGGNGYGGTGADGISFFLIDAGKVGAINASTRLGARGGSLGYSRSTFGLAGMAGGYLGVGIDEFGNFSNPRDNGTGGPGFVPNAIAMRGSQGTGYAYITGSRVNGSIAQGAAKSREGAIPITFNLSITTDGLLSLSYSRQGGVPNPVLTNRPITANNGDLPANFYFGFAGGTGGGSNIHEITCFKAAGITTSGSSAGSNVLQSAQVQIGTQLYLAYYHTADWWGQLTAQNLDLDRQTGKVSIRRTANWDASCTLTGGACKATGTTVAAQAPASRNILTFDGSEGIPFTAARLGATETGQPVPQPRASVMSSARIDYLRGDRGNEGFGARSLRRRIGVLGDIMNSSPTWVGPPAQGYDSSWNDALYPGTRMPEASSYPVFAAARATRTNVVYVGANDGMLHGFRSGGYTAQGAWDASIANDGAELIAYVPAAARATLRSSTAQLDYSGVQYAHNAYVDATPGVGDLFYAGAWHTWLVSGLGAGGNPGGVIGDNTTVGSGSIFALDITDPALFSEANAARLVLGEWNAASLQCAGDTTATRCGDSLGNTYGTPVVRRLHDGNWAVIFGNGFNSRSGKAGVFIMSVNSRTGATSTRFLDTGTGTATARNGIAYVTAVDLEGDHVIDYLYAGDLLGNVWRFDVSASDPARWVVRAQPLFQTGGLPITTQIVVSSVLPRSGPGRLMLNFGTGQLLPQTLQSAAVPNARVNYLFGVWDWDMASWNARAGLQWLALLPQTGGVAPGLTLTPQQLQLQTITTNAGYVNGNISGVRTITGNPVCWAGSRSCALPAQNGSFGWRAALPARQEQIIYNPVVQNGLFQVATYIPSSVPAFSCSATPPASGFSMAITPDQGIAQHDSYFATATGNVAALGNVVGLGLSAVGTPSFVTANGATYMVTQTAVGNASVLGVDPAVNPLTSRRVTWQIVR